MIGHGLNYTPACCRAGGLFRQSQAVYSGSAFCCAYFDFPLLFDEGLWYFGINFLKRTPMHVECWQRLWECLYSFLMPCFAIDRGRCFGDAFWRVFSPVQSSCSGLTLYLGHHECL